MSEWHTTRLGELGEINRGRSRHRPRDAAHLYGGIYPFIQTGDIKAAGGRIRRHTQTYSEAGLAQSRLWPQDTMVITIAANIAETGILGYPACFPDSVVGFIANPDMADVHYIEYYFRMIRHKLQQEHVGTGSVQDNINLQIIGEIELNIPPVPEQKAIAAILGALDDKIELNRKMNATLEGMARALFKSWFVDFDPVRAKSEGRQPFGMDSETASLFPSRLVSSELGDIPKGWKTGAIKELCDRIESGGTPSRNEPAFWQNGSISWLTSGEVRQKVVLTTKEKISELGLKNSNAKLWPAMSTVVAMYGATAGQVTLLANPMSANQACCALIPKGSTKSFVYIKASESVATYEDQATGSAQQNLNQTIVSELGTIIPSPACLEAFEAATSPYIDAIIQNHREIEKLSKTRDYLLPKLISGDIRIPDAEKFVEAA